MAYMTSHFFDGGTEAQYRAVVAVVHPEVGLPPGQTFHAAGPADGGWLVVAVWDSKESYDAFVAGTLMPAIESTEGAFVGPPNVRSTQVVNLVQS